jgi:hypothetical protein
MPPPIPTGPKFFAALGGQQTGPFDLPSFKMKIEAGQFNRDTLVWKEGMAQWTPAGQVPELASLFGAVPPPIPTP